MGVLDEIKAISAPAKLELGLGLSLAIMLSDMIIKHLLCLSFHCITFI